MSSQPNPLDALDLPEDDRAIYRRRIVGALDKLAVALSWTSGGRAYRITVDDLTHTMLLVRDSQRPTAVFAGTYRRRGKERKRWQSITVGLSLDRAARALHCHRAKACRLLAVLRDLGLVEIRKNYRVGRRGNVYGIVPEGRDPRPRPKPMPWTVQTPDDAPPPKIDPDDDPF